ncbi:MAG: ROK family protein, partial [Micrococcaceae bacterium]|nr:ROK family protein [Micrococcaceae bacterium]
EVIRALPNAWEHLELASIMKGFLGNRPAGVHRSVAVNIDRIANYSMLERLSSLPPFSSQVSPVGPIVYFGGRTALSGGLHNGSILYGVTGLAGEYGHLIVDPGGDPCWCGRTGCLETKIGLLSLHAQRFQSVTPIDRLSIEGPRLLNDLLAARDRHDEKLLSLLQEGGHWLAIAIDAIASIVNPGHVIIDGYLAQLGDPLVSTAIAEINMVRSFPAINGVDITQTDGDPARVLQGTLVAALRTVAALPMIAS